MEKIERRRFLKLALSLAAVAAGTASVLPSNAMPIMAPPAPPEPKAKPEPAVATQDDIDNMQPEQVALRRRRRRVIVRRRRRVIIRRRRRVIIRRRRRRVIILR